MPLGRTAVWPCHSPGPFVVKKALMPRTPDRWDADYYTREVTRYVKFEPDKVYVLTKNGVPYKVVPSKDISSFFLAADGGESFLVPWYGKEKFNKDFAPPPVALSWDEEPSITRMGTHYIPRRTYDFR